MAGTLPPVTVEPRTTGASGLTPSEIYLQVAPSVAYVETSLASGSGLLLDDGKLLTNAHVMWPYQTARVVFPNGTEVNKALLLGLDRIADLAVLDVSHATDLPDPAVFGNGGELAIGSPVFLIGYPAEAVDYPTPSITQGILSRKRSWDPLDVTYFQTDAVGEGGQSGGALVSERGEIIGITSLALGEGFMLAASIPDISTRVESLGLGLDVTGLGTREIGSLVGETEVQAEVPHFLAQQVWIMWPELGETVEVEVESRGDAWLNVHAPDGYAEVDADEAQSGTESGTFEAQIDGPHFVTVGSNDLHPIQVTVRASGTLVAHTDPDDGTQLQVGATQAGSVDYPGDADWFVLDLEEGQRVFVTAETLNFDAQLVIDQATNADDVLFWDDDSAGGIYGDTPAGYFTAPATGTYLVWVREAFFEDATAYDLGGYILSVEG
ncbi:MAG: trypsin-like peptidase domain-containing protein [Acidimicrobiia bacterium]